MPTSAWKNSPALGHTEPLATHPCSLFLFTAISPAVAARAGKPQAVPPQRPWRSHLLPSSLWPLALEGEYSLPFLLCPELSINLSSGLYCCSDVTGLCSFENKSLARAIFPSFFFFFFEVQQNYNVSLLLYGKVCILFHILFRCGFSAWCTWKE